jgi:hypothetical protein
LSYAVNRRVKSLIQMTASHGSAPIYSRSFG